MPYDVYMPPPSPSGEVGRAMGSGEVALLAPNPKNPSGEPMRSVQFPLRLLAASLNNQQKGFGCNPGKTDMQRIIKAA